MNSKLVSALEQAATLFGQGRLKEAEVVCRKLLSTNPNATDALHLLALVVKQRGDLDEAEGLLRTCIRIDAGRADMHANLGNLLIVAGRNDEAEEAYREALSIDSSFRPARLGLARHLSNIGEVSKAANEAQILIDQNANDTEAWNVLGTSQRLQGQWEDAEAAYRQALELNPGYAVARHNLGALLAQLSRSEDALTELDSASAAGIRGTEIDFNRASALMELFRFDEAERILTKTVVTTPGAVNAHTLLARIRFMRGTSSFADEYAAAVGARPEDVGLRVGYSRVLRGAGLFEHAQATLESALDLDKSDSRLLAELAAVHQDTGHFELALKHAQSAAKENSAESGVDDILIDALTCLGRADEAMPIIEMARRRNPLNQWYVAMEATVARLLGDPRYEELYDYDAFVRSYNLTPPDGWSSIEAFHIDLISVLKERHQFQSEPLDQSLRHGTQTARGLLGDPNPVIRSFLRAIREPLAEYRKDIGFDPDHPLRSRNNGDSELTGCWSVRLRRGGYHVNHVHSEGWISSAYYVELPPEVSDEAVKSGWIKFGEPRFEVPGAEPEKLVQPSIGRLVLFPSYMWHGTTPITGDDPRMTIAFDVIPKP